MTQALLNQILEQLEMLEREELQKLNQALQNYLSDPKLADFHQALLTSGLVRQIKIPHYGQISERRLVEVQGKLLSETIIEERR